MNVGLELYQRQHADLLGLAKALEEGLAVRWGAGSENAARRLLVRLSGKLTVHLNMEDRSLYPALLASPDPEVRGVAARFHESMGGLKSSTDEFLRHWLRPEAIAGEPEAFRTATRALLDALVERITAEDASLYPLVARAG